MNHSTGLGLCVKHFYCGAQLTFDTLRNLNKIKRFYASRLRK